MRRLRIVAACFALTAGCGGGITSPTVPATFTMRPGQSAHTPGIAVTFLRVVSDSRCPLNALCVWAGEATAAFTVSARGLDGLYDLQLYDPAKRTATHRGFVIEFQALEPFPIAGQPTKPADYRATIEVRQN